jgi:hypothetical protein
MGFVGDEVLIGAAIGLLISAVLILAAVLI